MQFYAREKRWILRQDLNLSVADSELTLKGSVFHSLGTATENAGSPLCFNRDHGMVSSNLLKDWCAQPEV